LKAQRALDTAKEAGELSDEEITAQEADVAKLQTAYETAKKALDDAKNGVATQPSQPTQVTETTSEAPATKTLDQKYKEMKVQASQARAAAKQAQKAVDEAKEAGQAAEEIKALEDTLAEAVQSYEKLNAKKLVLQEKVKLQKEAPATKTSELSQASEPNIQTASDNKSPEAVVNADDIDPAQKAKELKVAASQTKAAWRKLERELTAAQEAGDETSALETQVAEAKAKYDQANEAKTAAMDALKG